MHVETLESLARRKAGKTRAEILEDVPFSDGGKFSECLEALEACGFVRSFDALGKAKKDRQRGGSNSSNRFNGGVNSQPGIF